MIRNYCGLLLVLFIFLSSCSATKSIPVSTKLSPSELREDFAVLKGVLEESHPSLDWFAPKDSIYHFFENQYESLKDSMTIFDFKHFISATLSPIKCAHTSCSFSGYHLSRSNNSPSVVYPFHLRAIGDTLVTANVTDTTVNQNFIRGTIIKKINNIPGNEIISTLKNYVQSDGFNESGKISQLNGNIILTAYFYQIIARDSIWNIEFVNRFGETESASFKVKKPVKKDSTVKETPKDTSSIPKPALPKLNSYRNLQIDTSLSSGFMTINTFKNDGNLDIFFRRSFKALRKNNIQYLVIDLRRNTGGLMSSTTKLLSYVKDSSFHMAQEAYGIRRNSSYKKYITNYWKNRVIHLFSTKDDKGLFHLKFYEKHTFRLKKKNHFDGQIFVLNGGLSYSASAIFAQKMKGQQNVTIIGEETGGGAYGTTAMGSYKILLPNSKINVNVPLYRLIIDSTLQQTGRGVEPDIALPVTLMDFRLKRDPVTLYLKDYLSNLRVDQK
ncbi:S41 family peptidase [Gynurincola endophyticus]|uniref:S41 family peptidase n=1 Tax=Gynurincola endophyticus TaxID=2479004 RepID=UPI000F8D645E|nr:S41 family peptidase [Gynurincola endophyticus]